MIPDETIFTGIKSVMHYVIPTIVSRPCCDPYTAAYSILRSTQFIAAVLTAAVCGIDLGAWTRSHHHADSRWVYAEVVAGFSAISSLVLGVQGPTAQSTARLTCRCLLDSIMSLLWLVSSAVYGQIAARGASTVVLAFSKSAVNAAFCLSVLSTLMWLAAAIMTCVPFCGKKKARNSNVQVGGFTVEEVQGLGKMPKENLVGNGERKPTRHESRELCPPPPYSDSDAKKAVARTAKRLGKTS